MIYLLRRKIISKQEVAGLTTRKRDLNLDLIRCIAVFSVISVHFFLNSQFYTTPLIGKRMYLMTAMRTACMICVPLFLLLTGYLMNKKTLSLSYYKGIKKVIGIYLLASAACILFSIFYFNETVTIKEALIRIAGFTGAPYSWYIEMYLGLFLIIPFLNLIYNNLKSRKQKQGLLATLLALTVLPSLFNIYVNIFPDYWTDVYPVAYYFIGAYIGEFNVRLEKRTNIALIVIVILISSAFDIHRNYNIAFQWGTHNYWNGAGIFLLSTLIFIFIKNINLEKITPSVRKGIIKISELSLTIYLVSWIFDIIAYSKLNSVVTPMQNRLEYFLITVLFVFTGSTLLSVLINWLYKLIEKAESKILCIFDVEKLLKRVS